MYLIETLAENTVQCWNILVSVLINEHTYEAEHRKHRLLQTSKYQKGGVANFTFALWIAKGFVLFSEA